MALVPQILGHTVFNYLLGEVEATVVAIAVMGEPVGASLLALGLLRRDASVVGGRRGRADPRRRVRGDHRAGPGANRATLPAPVE